MIDEAIFQLSRIKEGRIKRGSSAESFRGIFLKQFDLQCGPKMTTLESSPFQFSALLWLIKKVIYNALKSGSKILIDTMGRSNIYALQATGKYLKTKIVIHNTKVKIMYST